MNSFVSIKANARRLFHARLSAQAPFGENKIIKNTKIATGTQNSPDKKLQSLFASMVVFGSTQKLCNKIDELMAQGANVNGEKGKGELLLMAVNHGNAVALRELLVRGADPHVRIRKNGCNTTLLHVAAGKGANHSPKVILLLVAAGLDTYEIKNSSGLTAKDVAAKSESVSRTFSYPLHFSVKAKDMALCCEFLRRGFNPETTDYRGETSAAIAKRCSCTDITALFDAAKAMQEIDKLLLRTSAPLVS